MDLLSPFSQEAQGLSAEIVNIEYRTRNRRISKWNRDFEHDKRLITFAVGTVRAEESVIAR